MSLKANLRRATLNPNRAAFHKADSATFDCRRNIEMTRLCKIEVTHPGVLGSREVHRGGVVDEQAGVQPP